jgi:Hint module
MMPLSSMRLPLWPHFFLLLVLTSALQPVRATSPSQVPGEYTLLQASAGAGCPSTITHAAEPAVTTGSPVLALSHGSIGTAGGGACADTGGNSYVALLSADAYTTRVQTPANKSDPLVEALLRTNALFGIETGDRTCGKFVLRKGAVVAFANNPKEQFLEDFEGLKEGKTLMLLAETEVPNPKRCVYMSTSMKARSGKQASNCFPATARFHLAQNDAASQTNSGATVQGLPTIPAIDLAHGTHLSTGAVLAFTHKEESGTHEYVRLTAASGAELVVSPGHYVVLRSGRLRAASAVRVGDQLAAAPEAVGASDSSHVIAAFAMVQRHGRFNPHTRAGIVHVDGFVVSCYTTAVHPLLAHRGIGLLYFLQRLAHPRIVNALTRPLSNHALPLWVMRFVPGGPDHFDDERLVKRAMTDVKQLNHMELSEQYSK